MELKRSIVDLQNIQQKIEERFLFDESEELQNIIDELTIISNRPEPMPKIKESHFECALKNLSNIANRKAERWSIVGALFGLGSGSATKLCQEYNIDPFEIIGKDKCDNCELLEEQ